MGKKVIKDSLGERIKRYENANRNYLTRNIPVIIRLDGKAFHTFTKGCEKPFDANLMQSMIQTSFVLMNEIQGAKVSYTQSDEISILLTDYDTLETQAWFNYNISKILSISAASTSVNFNHIYSCIERKRHTDKLALFDSRAFNIPKEDVANYFLWRAKDWERNSLQMYCQSFFSHKQLHKKKKQDMYNMLFEIGKNWTTDLYAPEKNGTFLIKNDSKIITRQDIKPLYQSISEIITPFL